MPCMHVVLDLKLEPQGLKGAVSNLIYMAGYALPEGMSTFDNFKEFGKLENVPLVFDMAEDHTIVLRDAPLEP